MTTTVTVTAHCDPKTTQVRVKITGVHGLEGLTILEDGESAGFCAYDDLEVSVREVSREVC